ncbi:hypothetical protein T492DRAFT_1131421 [Pavlovales sp. CCMP2436]|nr:hypothetical protein T492DRAFT_1131421 [Pavlovales sp. CCMP2436]
MGLCMSRRPAAQPRAPAVRDPSAAVAFALERAEVMRGIEARAEMAEVASAVLHQLSALGTGLLALLIAVAVVQAPLFAQASPGAAGRVARFAATLSLITLHPFLLSPPITDDFPSPLAWLLDVLEGFAFAPAAWVFSRSGALRFLWQTAQSAGLYLLLASVDYRADDSPLDLDSESRKRAIQHGLYNLGAAIAFILSFVAEALVLSTTPKCTHLRRKVCLSLGIFCAFVFLIITQANIGCTHRVPAMDCPALLGTASYVFECGMALSVAAVLFLTATEPSKEISSTLGGEGACVNFSGWAQHETREGMRRESYTGPWHTLEASQRHSQRHTDRKPVLPRAGALEVHGAPCFLHALHLHPALAGRFREAFGGPEGLFAAIYRHFLPLERSRQARIDASFASLLGLSPGAGAADAGRPLTVGVHVRNGGDFRSAKLSAIEWSRLARSALELLPRERRAAVVFFVAADGAASRETARETFTNLLGSSARVLLLPGLVKRAGCKADDADCTVSREGARVSLLELSLLAACDVRVLSPMSSFSEMAAAVSARRAAYFHSDLQRKFHYETAVEVLPRVFVPHTVEMPASIALGRTLDALPCGPAVRAAAGADDVWTRPHGLIFLNGSRAMPHTLARKYASID